MKGAALHCCRTAPGVKPFRAFPPCGSAKQVNLLCTRSLRRLTIEVWHQTSGCNSANNLRDDQLVLAGIDMEACHRKCVTFHLHRIHVSQCRKVTFSAFFVSRPDGWKAVPLLSEIKGNKDMQSIYSEFREKVVAMPDAMAVQDGSRTLTYAQLDALADTIATGFPIW